jgi:flagellar biosynthesis/type III secretory pathway M-ring protein FliF/YscJ
MDRREVIIRKESCELPVEESPAQSQQDEEGTGEQNLNTTAQPEDDNQGGQKTVEEKQFLTGATVQSIEVPFIESPWFIVLLVVSNIVVILAIFGMTLVLIRR